MAVHLIIILAIAFVLGALVFAVGAVAGFWLGGAAADPGSVQVRTNLREMMAERKARQEQFEAARGKLGEVIHDPRTPLQTRLHLERELAPLLTERKRHEG